MTNGFTLYVSVSSLIFLFQSYKQNYFLLTLLLLIYASTSDLVEAIQKNPYALYLVKIGLRSIRLFLLQVVTFRPDGTSDALHFYINGREMEIDVEVDPVQSGIRRKL